MGSESPSRAPGLYGHGYGCVTGTAVSSARASFLHVLPQDTCQVVCMTGCMAYVFRTGVVVCAVGQVYFKEQRPSRTVFAPHVLPRAVAQLSTARRCMLRVLYDVCGVCVVRRCMISVASAA